MPDQPMTAAARAALREQRQQRGAAHGRRQAIEAYASIRCAEGVHAPDGCENDGSGCLCGCHDPKDTP